MQQHSAMDNRGHTNVLERLVKLFRSLTITIKAVPYISLLIYCVYLVLSCGSNEKLLNIFDIIYGYSIGVCLLFLLMSRTLELCSWHRIACVIPTTSMIVSFVDDYIFPFAFDEICMINISILIMVVCYLIWSFFHFFIDGK